MAANNTVIAMEVENKIRHSNETECSLNLMSFAASFAHCRIDPAVVGRIRIVVAVFVVVRNHNIAAF